MNHSTNPSAPPAVRIAAEPSDAELAGRLATGDEDALAALYARHATGVLRLAARLLGSADDAEDVMQDVFVGLPLALRGYAERGAFSSWLKRVTIRTALMRLRSVRRRRLEPLDALDTSRSAVPPDAIIERLDLEAAIGSLPDALRSVFVLHDIEHVSHAEIADLLGIRRGTSEVRLFRALRQLRRTLENDR